MYEDDGLTREHRNGAFSKTLLECDGPDFGSSGIVTITVGESMGDYEGKPSERSNRFEVHVHGHPEIVKLNDVALTEFSTMEELEQAIDGWYYDPDVKLGIAFVKTQSLPTNTAFTVVLDVPVCLGKINVKDRVKVFPSPTDGIVSVVSEGLEIVRIAVYDLSGKSLNDSIQIQHQLKSAEIDLSSQPIGIYFIHVVTDKGSFKEKVTLVH
jgi:hypothetical protein